MSSFLQVLQWPGTATEGLIQNPGKLIKRLGDQSFKHLLSFKPVAGIKEVICLHIYAFLLCWVMTKVLNMSQSRAPNRSAHCPNRVHQCFASVAGLSSVRMAWAEENHTERGEPGCSEFPTGKIMLLLPQVAFCKAYFLGQQFSRKKLLSSVWRNDGWPRTSAQWNWSCSSYLDKLSPQIWSDYTLVCFSLLCV